MGAADPLEVAAAEHEAANPPDRGLVDTADLAELLDAAGPVPRLPGMAGVVESSRWLER